jgi:hypothetical protein
MLQENYFKKKFTYYIYILFQVCLEMTFLICKFL